MALAIAEALDGIEQLANIVDPQHARAAERGAVDRIGRDGRNHVHGRGGQVPRPDGDHRLDPRQSPRRRQKKRAIAHRAHMQQHGAGAHVSGEVVQQIAELDVAAVASAHHVGEADAMPLCPFDHAHRHRSRLRNQREIARRGPGRNQTGVQPQGRCLHAERPWPEHPQAMGAPGIGKRGLEPVWAAFPPGQRSGPRPRPCLWPPAGRPTRACCGAACTAPRGREQGAAHRRLGSTGCAVRRRGGGGPA